MALSFFRLVAMDDPFPWAKPCENEQSMVRTSNARELDFIFLVNRLGFILAKISHEVHGLKGNDPTI